jgi:hypothetical protein
MIKMSIFVILLVFVAGCASPSASNGSVFKSNEVETDVFSSSVTGR